MGRSMDPLVLGRVIGDVLDMFVPAVDMKVTYGNRQVNNGCEIKPSATQSPPLVQITFPNDEEASLFTLVMVDPDAPSPSEPSMREWVHWIVADIPSGVDISQGREILQYVGPKPPTGIHRYVFVVFRQMGPMLMLPPLMRNNFSTRWFAQEYYLGLPVAAVYFNAQKEPASRRRG